MYVCMYVCMHIYMHVYIHTHIPHTYPNFIYTHKCILYTIHIHSFIWMYAYTSVYMYINT